jgi:hypothetical protein
VGGRFIESLLGATDEVAMRSAVEERAGLVREIRQRGQTGARSGSRPVCREQNETCGARPADSKTFVEAIT